MDRILGPAKTMRKRVVMKILCLALFLIPVMFGCSMRKTPSDIILGELQWHAYRFADMNQVDAEQRVRLAISKWQNGVVDPEPILIEAFLKTSIDGERCYLALNTFDEDADLAGFVIKEEHVDSNGVRATLVEEYPVFTHSSYQNVAGFKTIPVMVRDGSQRKPKDQWQEYLSTPRQQLEDEYKKRLKSDFAGTYKEGFWKDTLPPILVSVPQPNKVYVQLYVYDRAGHVSERVSLVHVPRKERGLLND